MTLIVKKPDYLGKSKWEFQIRHYNSGLKNKDKYSSIYAKISDEKWLDAFQNGSLPQRQVPLPRDGLHVRANITKIKKDKNLSFETEEYDIIEVIRVIKGLSLPENLMF
jgi:hypothetical protein